MPLTSVLGLVMCALVAIAIALHLGNVSRFPLGVRAAVFAFLALAMAMPVDGVMIAAYIRGFIGDPSIATIAPMTLVCIKQLTRRDVCDDRNVSALLLVVLLSGVGLYPLALGLSPYDPYALGFGSWGLYFALLAIAVVAWRFELHLVVIWIVASILCYTFGFFESTNLWNYLLDPIAVVIALGWAVAKLIGRIRQSNHTNHTRERSLA